MCRRKRNHGPRGKGVGDFIGMENAVSQFYMENMANINRAKVRPFQMALLFAAILLASLWPTGKAFSGVPRGVFCLLPSSTGGAGKDPAIYSNPDIDGISVRQKWSDLELQQSAFDWTFLDTVIAKAAAAGKVVSLRIGTSGGEAALGGSSPGWVFDAVRAEGLPASQKFFTFDDQGMATTIPVFWDPVYLAAKTAMIKAVGLRYADNPAVKIVSASFANATSEDWAVPHTAIDVTRWLAAGYTTSKMLAAGKRIIDTTMAAFPKQYVTLAVGANGHVGAQAGPNLDPDENYLALNAVLTARTTWPGRLIVQKNSLQTAIPAAPGIGTPWELESNSSPDIAGQMLWYCYGDTTYRMNGGVAIDPSAALRKSVDMGVAYGMKYIEIYHVDVVSLLAATHYAHTALLQAPAAPTQLRLTP